MMQYNECGICKAKDGRAGHLIGNPSLNLVDACDNCHDTRTAQAIVVHSNLVRTEEELQRTINIIKK